MRRALVQWALWFGLWVALIDERTLPELLIGAACSAVAALAGELAWGQHLTAFGANPRLLIQIWRLPKVFAVGTFEIFTVLFKHLFTCHKAESLMLSVPFDAGAEDDPNDAARRALAVAYTTMSPNFIVIAVNGGRLHYHQIARSDVPEMTRKLGACP